MLFDTLTTTAGRFAGIDVFTPVNGAVRLVAGLRPAAQVGVPIVTGGGAATVVVVLDEDVVVVLLDVVVEVLVVVDVVVDVGPDGASWSTGI